MNLKKLLYITIIPLFFLWSCKDEKSAQQTSVEKESIAIDTISQSVIKEEAFVLTEENAIDFFFKYQKDLQETKIKIETNHGEFTILLFDNVPYHKANFIYLTKKGYFNNTQFHRVVENFIIQGGNSDDAETSAKRRKIGRYLLPPDTRKGHKHHRGTVSMPSSENDNPHKLASPYEFFIVVTKPGSYHLDKDYTPFGKVITGMDVVDKINQQAVGKGDWPQNNVYIKEVTVLE